MKKHDAHELMNLDFQLVSRGYNMDEVNQLREEISEDYLQFEEEIKALKTKVLTLEGTNAQLQAQLKEVNDRNNKKIQTDNRRAKSEFSSPEMVKRIALIEGNMGEIKTLIEKLAEKIA